MRKGHPVLGGISGFFLFLFVTVDLVLFGVLPFTTPLLTIMPIVGAVVGAVLGKLAPFGPKQAPATPAAAVAAPEEEPS